MLEKNPFCFLLTQLQMIATVVKHPSLPNSSSIWSFLNGLSPSLKDWITQDVAVACKILLFFYCLNCITKRISNVWANSHFLKYSSYWLSWLREGLLFGFLYYCTLDVTSSGWMFQTEHTWYESVGDILFSHFQVISSLEKVWVVNEEFLLQVSTVYIQHVSQAMVVGICKWSVLHLRALKYWMQLLMLCPICK